MTDPQEAAVENALLRGTLFLTASALKEYHDAPHFEIDDGGVPKVEVIVSEMTRGKAAEALLRADKLLRGGGMKRRRLKKFTADERKALKLDEMPASMYDPLRYDLKTPFIEEPPVDFDPRGDEQ